MATFTLTEILESTRGQLLKEGVCEFKGVSTDTRKIKPGELFIPLTGQNFDGHDFIDEAKKRGAVGSLIQESGNGKIKPSTTEQDFTLIKVVDTLRALQDLAAFHRRRFKLEVITVTGSTGKTTCKEMIFSILSKTFNTLKSEGNLNNIIGLPLTLLQLRPEHQVAVLELGMNRLGEIDRMAEVAGPTVGVITNIGPAHLQYLGSLEGVKEAKAELIPHLSKAGKLILNADDPKVMELSSRATCPVTTFGLNSGAQVHPQNINSLGTRGFSFQIKTTLPTGAGFLRTCPVTAGEGRHCEQTRKNPLLATEEVGGSPVEINIVLPVIGRHNILNALAASAVAISMGLDLKTIEEGLTTFHPVSGRMEVIELNRGITLLNDAYNANPKSMAEALKALSEVKGERRAIAVLGDMLELGDVTEEAHIKLGQLIAAAGVDNLIAVGAEGEHIEKGARLAGFPSHNLKLCPSWKEAGESLKSMVKPGDLILLKASRKIGLDNLLSYLQEM